MNTTRQIATYLCLIQASRHPGHVSTPVWKKADKTLYCQEKGVWNVERSNLFVIQTTHWARPGTTNKQPQRLRFRHALSSNDAHWSVSQEPPPAETAVNELNIANRTRRPPNPGVVPKIYQLLTLRRPDMSPQKSLTYIPHTVTGAKVRWRTPIRAIFGETHHCSHTAVQALNFGPCKLSVWLRLRCVRFPQGNTGLQRRRACPLSQSAVAVVQIKMMAGDLMPLRSRAHKPWSCFHAHRGTVPSQTEELPQGYACLAGMLLPRRQDSIRQARIPGLQARLGAAVPIRSPTDMTISLSIGRYAHSRSRPPTQLADCQQMPIPPNPSLC